jgi:hypothetical protein
MVVLVPGNVIAACSGRMVRVLPSLCPCACTAAAAAAVKAVTAAWLDASVHVDAATKKHSSTPPTPHHPPRS